MKDIIWLIEEYARKELEQSEKIIECVSSWDDDRALKEATSRYNIEKETFERLINYLKRK